MRRRRRIRIAVSATLLCIAQLSGCSKSKEQEAAEAFAAKMAEAAKKCARIAGTFSEQNSDGPFQSFQICYGVRWVEKIFRR